MRKIAEASVAELDVASIRQMPYFGDSISESGVGMAPK
jgi:hypothetical protein